MRFVRSVYICRQGILYAERTGKRCGLIHALCMVRKITPVPKPKAKRRPTFIRAWRKHRALTLETLAERVGITHASLSRIERGEQPYNQDILDRIADALMCGPADLLIRDPSDPDGIWSLWDQAKTGEAREEIVEHARLVIRRTGTGG